VHRTLQTKVNSERCISSVQELNKDSIELSLSTQTRRVSKLSRLSYYTPYMYIYPCYCLTTSVVNLYY